MATCSVLSAVVNGDHLTGDYIDWVAVEEFLLHMRDQLMSPPLLNAGAHQRASLARLILATLEMMYGQDIEATYTGWMFSANTLVFPELLLIIAQAQDTASQSSNPNAGGGWIDPSLNPSPSDPGAVEE